MRPLLVATLCLALSACSIERSKQLGDPCLEPRECASGRCEYTASGISVCATHVVVDVPGLPQDAANDQGTDLPVPTDLGAEVTPPADAGLDVPGVDTVSQDTGTTGLDTGPDAGPDAGPDVGAGTDTAADGGADGTAGLDLGPDLGVVRDASVDAG